MSNTELFSEMKLPMFLGKDASGNPLIGDLTRMPHMLIAGTTGSGGNARINCKTKPVIAGVSPENCSFLGKIDLKAVKFG